MPHSSPVDRVQKVLLVCICVIGGMICHDAMPLCPYSGASLKQHRRCMLALSSVQCRR